MIFRKCLLAAGLAVSLGLGAATAAAQPYFVSICLAHSLSSVPAEICLCR